MAKLRQSGKTSAMILEYCRNHCRALAPGELQAGDLIMTGTPAGVAAVQRGDRLQAQVTGLAPLQVERS